MSQTSLSDPYLLNLWDEETIHQLGHNLLRLEAALPTRAQK